MKKRNGRRAIKKREKKALKRYEEFMKPFYTAWDGKQDAVSQFEEMIEVVRNQPAPRDTLILNRADFEPTLRVLTIRDVEL